MRPSNRHTILAALEHIGIPWPVALLIVICAVALPLVLAQSTSVRRATDALRLHGADLLISYDRCAGWEPTAERHSSCAQATLEQARSLGNADFVQTIDGMRERKRERERARDIGGEK